MDTGLRISIRVRPGSSRVAVGGSYGTDVLVVAVTARAVDGAANRAVVAALAQAFGVRRGDVEIATGHSGRTKSVLISGDRAALERRYALLLSQP